MTAPRIGRLNRLKTPAPISGRHVTAAITVQSLDPFQTKAAAPQLALQRFAVAAARNNPMGSSKSQQSGRAARESFVAEPSVGSSGGTGADGSIEQVEPAEGVAVSHCGVAGDGVARGC